VGEHFVSSKDVLIETVLGSCIAVCLRDPLAKVAGMNHFLLPGDGGDSAHQSGRYGVHAMALLIKDMLAQGANISRMEAKVFGGGNINCQTITRLKIGDQNTRFIMDFLSAKGIQVVAQDVGDEVGRRIVFFTGSGQVKVRRLDKAESSKVENAKASTFGKLFQSKIFRDLSKPEKSKLTQF